MILAHTHTDRQLAASSQHGRQDVHASGGGGAGRHVLRDRQRGVRRGGVPGRAPGGARGAAGGAGGGRLRAVQRHRPQPGRQGAHEEVRDRRGGGGGAGGARAAAAALGDGAQAGVRGARLEAARAAGAARHAALLLPARLARRAPPLAGSPSRTASLQLRNGQLMK